MTTDLVRLTGPDTRWSRDERPLFVGKDIIELLSTSMYLDPMSMYREYIQNAADAIDIARSIGLIHDRGRVDIRVDEPSRIIRIRDNGAGIARSDFWHELTALGGSKKRGTQARGFRGVGRLAGLAFCQELIFRSRKNGENTVHELRWDSREIRRLLRSTDSSCDLREVVHNGVESREVGGQAWPEHFFEVELRGIIRHRNDRLLKEQDVAGYLAQVSPVQFHAEFKQAAQITTFLESNGVSVGPIQIEVSGYGSVHRPHRDQIQIGRQGVTQGQELKTFQIPGREGNLAAVGWVFHHEYHGALPSTSLVEGLRLRAGDMQIGDNTLLQSLFPEPRFNTWCIGEIHILDRRIVPNGRRDHFEQNTFYFDLLNHLTPHAREIARRCRANSAARSVTRSVEIRLVDCEQRIRVLQKGVISDSSTVKLKSELRVLLDALEQTLRRSAVSPDKRLAYQTRTRKLRQRLTRLTDGRSGTALAKFSPAQRALLKEVFDVLYRSQSDLREVRRLTDKVISRLTRRIGLHRKQLRRRNNSRRDSG